MVNNKQTNNEQTNNIIATIMANVVGGDDPVRAIPLQVGDKLHFKLDNNLITKETTTINGRQITWGAIHCTINDTDAAISLQQIVRRRNGLNLIGNSVSDCIKSFLSLFDNNGTLTIQITKIITRNFVNRALDGTEQISTSNYYIFTKL